jgi:hypothetical protein
MQKKTNSSGVSAIFLGGEAFAPASAASLRQVCRARGEALAANVRRVPEDN